MINSFHPARQPAYGAYTLIDLLLAIAVLGILAAVTGYALSKQQARRQETTCLDNLRQVALAFKQSSMNCGDRFPMQVPASSGGSQDFMTNGVAWPHFQVISNELGAPSVLVCPQDGKRAIATNFAALTDRNVSYFVGADAQDIYPQMWLSGDANFAISNVPVKPGLVALGTNTVLSWNDRRHKGSGNIAFADGSVRQLSSTQLFPAPCTTEDGTNRLAMP
jgi:prepilin-type processing-associated H-X9-DG protein